MTSNHHHSAGNAWSPHESGNPFQTSSHNQQILRTLEFILSNYKISSI